MQCRVPGLGNPVDRIGIVARSRPHRAVARRRTAASSATGTRSLDNSSPDEYFSPRRLRSWLRHSAEVSPRDCYAGALLGVIGAFVYLSCEEGKMAIRILNSFRSVIAVSVLALTTLLGTGCAGAQDKSVLDRLQRLEDKEAIYTVMERFFEYQETRNRDAYANLFAKNGELILRVGHQKGGPEGIRGTGRTGDGDARNRDSERAE